MTTVSPLFGIVPAGHQLITEPISTPAPGSFLYTLPVARSFSHIVVFLLPNAVLPETTAAAIYLAAANDVEAATRIGGSPRFQFLGAVGPGKESAIFKLGPQFDLGSGGLMIGVSIETADIVGRNMLELTTGKTAKPNVFPTPSTILLAQRIIQNAFHFLASFSGSAGPGGIEVVPLRAFENWWRKFESRIRSDPSFLEKPSD
ncbi:hypothetical protein CDD83_3972 [Cordyceps sp. RAO-2017]|nr:hypothetical protein CDD83_3972 [Cordyceps sp. RAO-2017]